MHITYHWLPLLIHETTLNSGAFDFGDNAGRLAPDWRADDICVNMKRSLELTAFLFKTDKEESLV